MIDSRFPYLLDLNVPKRLLNVGKKIGFCRECYLKSAIDPLRRQLDLQYDFNSPWTCDVEDCNGRYEYEITLTPPEVIDESTNPEKEC